MCRHGVLRVEMYILLVSPVLSMSSQRLERQSRRKRHVYRHGRGRSAGVRGGAGPLPLWPRRIVDVASPLSLALPVRGPSLLPRTNASTFTPCTRLSPNQWSYPSPILILLTSSPFAVVSSLLIPRSRALAVTQSSLSPTPVPPHDASSAPDSHLQPHQHPRPLLEGVAERERESDAVSRSDRASEREKERERESKSWREMERGRLWEQEPEQKRGPGARGSGSGKCCRNARRRITM
ncbi:hypothetical protein B0H12DRAFT_750343 [Mycena haematopus]|nr:hypothetical protein B0H12DRAFT_750343 [Mycena haematopus]